MLYKVTFQQISYQILYQIFKWKKGVYIYGNIEFCVVQGEHGRVWAEGDGGRDAWRDGHVVPAQGVPQLVRHRRAQLPVRQPDLLHVVRTHTCVWVR